MKSLQTYKYIRLVREYAENCSYPKSLQNQSQHWGGELQLSMEVVSLYYFNNENQSIIYMLFITY